MLVGSFFSTCSLLGNHLVTVMTIDEIKTILKNCEVLIELVEQSPNFQALTESGYWHTSNELFLNDAILALREVYCAVETVQDQEEKQQIESLSPLAP